MKGHKLCLYHFWYVTLHKLSEHLSNKFNQYYTILLHPVETKLLQN